MSSSTSMRFLEERHVAIVVDLLVWSHRMDLLALSNVRGEVSLQRLTWQKVWTLAPPNQGLMVTAMAWRPDSKILAVAYSNGELLLVDVENGDVVHSLKNVGEVSCLSWPELKEEEKISPCNFMEENSKLLPPLPLLSRSFGPISKEENAEDSKQISSQKKLNLLVSGTVNGVVSLHALGLLACGSIDMTNVFEGKKCRVLSVAMDSAFKSLIATISVESDDGWLLNVVHLDTSKVASHSEQLLILVKQHGLILSQVAYLGQTMSSITEAWENILMEMDSNLSKYASQVGPGAVSADFLDLLMLGSASTELQTFLLNDLTEKGLKKLGHSIELSYTNIQKLVLKHLQAVGAAIYFHTSGLTGMANEKLFQEIGLCSELILRASISAAAFITKATEVQQVIDSSMKNYKAFFRWLYAAILRLSDERIPPEIVKMRQQELSFIAEFLEKFDELPGDADGNKPKFNLERLGQYLVDKDLTTPGDASSNTWYKFLSQDPELRDNPAIIPRFEKMSLVQQHKHLLAATDELFAHPSSSFPMPLLQKKIIHFVKEISQLRISTFCHQEKFMVTFVDRHGAHGTLQYADICLKTVEDPARKIAFKFTETVSHKVLDVQFFSEETVSVLLEQEQENKMAVFLQFPSRIAMDHASAFPGEPKEATNYLEPNSLRSLENMVGAQLAVSGERKVAVVLSESRRRVRLFEMEAEEDEDEEETLNSTRESDQGC
ncbi:anaphase-promoting complex subunit 4 [Neocloeon triangulifer]|uniref:anaphase-promoting complex subunit 4 n=1 Tax=Neocloeon triangulifer TaxID=2078957 RepID=UPI00286EF48B|nr:anaphase-promoting complex subunit 4 [Neocloeon triangulifer]XP_059480352.1 anaphase-promoting complex subunit 4 [Neocloeon triangulifer]